MEYGWLGNDGTFYACDYAGHLVLSEEICRKKGWKFFETLLDDFDISGSEELLERRGFIKLTGYGNSRWFEPKYPPTQKQLDVLLTWEMDTGKTIKWLDQYR